MINISLKQIAHVCCFSCHFALIFGLQRIHMMIMICCLLFSPYDQCNEAENGNINSESSLYINFVLQKGRGLGEMLAPLFLTYVLDYIVSVIHIFHEISCLHSFGLLLPMMLTEHDSWPIKCYGFHFSLFAFVQTFLNLKSQWHKCKFCFGCVCMILVERFTAQYVPFASTFHLC